MSGHDFDPLSGFCRRCGLAEAWVDYRPTCTPAPLPPQTPKPEPEPSPLYRALARDPWARIDGRFKR